MHVHNFFPLLTPSIFEACREAGVPTVMTLHNFRLISPNAMLMHNGQADERSIQGSAYWCSLHGCYRGSRLGTLLVAHMIETHRRRKTWHSRVDQFIALTEFAKRKFIEGGLPAQKIAVKPNFCHDMSANRQHCSGGALFVGRLSIEKGVMTMMRAWRTIDVPLKVIGDGPLYEYCAGLKLGNISLLGRCSSEQVCEEMANAAFLVAPSECYEGFPVVIAEAFACGLPVLASRLGAMEEIVEDGVSGLHFIPGDADDLACKARWAYEHPQEIRRMGGRARIEYVNKYTPEANYQRLMEIYAEAVAAQKQELAI